MRLTRSAMVATAGSVALLGAFAGSASATATLSTSNLLPQGQTIQVTYSGLTIPQGGGNFVVIQWCQKNDAGVFNQNLDCNQSMSINPTLTGGGTVDFEIVGGDDPNLGEWGCGPLTSPGVPKADTCYVRLAPGNVNNTATDEFYPITFTATPVTTTTEPATTTTAAPGNDVPEVPVNVLLPLGAAAVIGGGIAISRRRTAKSAA